MNRLHWLRQKLLKMNFGARSQTVRLKQDGGRFPIT